MARPTLGIRFHGSMAPKTCVELAISAEALGFDSIWFAENPFEFGVLPAMAGCAVATKKLRIGVGVFNPFVRHPTLMAGEMAALDQLSDGRAILGIGAGLGPAIEKLMPYQKPLAAMRDAVAIARGLLDHLEVDYQGAMFAARQVKTKVRPVRANMPIYLAAMAEASVRLCGEIADGLIIGNMCPPEYTRHAIALMGEGAAKGQRAAPQTIVKYVPCSVAADPRQARDMVKPQIAAMLTSYLSAFKGSPGVVKSITTTDLIAPERFPKLVEQIGAGARPTEALDDAFVAAYAVAGTAEQCLAQCDALQAGGATEIVLSFIGDDPQGQMRALGKVMEAA